MAGRIELVISADASNAIKTVKAMQTNINNLAKNLPKMEMDFAKSGSAEDLQKINQQMSEILSLIDRAASAINQANPSISEAQAKYEMLTNVIESLGREYGGLDTESLKYLKDLRNVVQETVSAENSTKKMAVAQNSLVTATKAAGIAAKTSSNYFKKLNICAIISTVQPSPHTSCI